MADQVREAGKSFQLVGGEPRDCTSSVVLERAKQAGLDWPAVQALTEEALESRLYTRPLAAVAQSAGRPWPDIFM